MTLPSVPPTAHRRRRRWPIVLAIVVVLLIAVPIAAEGAARSYATGVAQKKLAAALGVSSPKNVSVKLGAGSIILQALRGHIDRVAASTAEASIGGISGALDLTATGVPVNAGGTVSTVSARYVIPASQAGALTKAAGLKGATISLASSTIHVEAKPVILGATITVTAVVTPTVSGGRVVLTPGDVTVAGGLHIPDSIVHSLISTTSFCVNSQLPAGLDLSSIGVNDSHLVLTLNGTDVDLASGTKGQCS